VASIALAGVGKIYPGGHVALRDLDLEVADGELMVLVGPSGCGKTTVLRLVAGLETPSSGAILIGGRDVTGLPPQERDVAMVFQSYALYPHLSVRDNLGFGLRARGVARATIAERVGRVASALGLEPVLERKPAQLSGGQRQRVALGRAIVREPRAFLFDEPLSNLDARLRVETRGELARLHQRLGATMLYVTHDQEEAMTLGDRVAVIRDGMIEQVAAPLDVYSRPATAFVAGFIGSPGMNLLSGVVEPGGTARLAGAIVLPSPAVAGASRAVSLGVRPQHVRLVQRGTGDVDGQVDLVEARGSDLVVHLRVGEGAGRATVRAVAPADREFPGGTLGIRLDRRALHWFDATSGERLE
jgi:multiple sugar transport system ATP-binding protein